MVATDQRRIRSLSAVWTDLRVCGGIYLTELGLFPVVQYEDPAVDLAHRQLAPPDV